MADYLVELGHFLEEVEKRLLYGRQLTAILLSLAVASAILWLSSYLVFGFLWPLVHTIISGASQLPRMPRPLFPNIVSVIFPWLVLIVLFVGIVALARRFNNRIYAQFQRLEETISRYEEIIWLPPTYEKKIEIAERLKKLGKHSVYIAHTGQQDCYEFAAELSDIFQQAGWAVAPIRPDADSKAHATRSIEFVGKDENLTLIRSVSDAFIGLTRQASSSTSALYEGYTDILVKIGPRKMRSGEFL